MSGPARVEVDDTSFANDAKKTTRSTMSKRTDDSTTRTRRSDKGSKAISEADRQEARDVYLATKWQSIHDHYRDQFQAWNQTTENKNQYLGKLIADRKKAVTKVWDSWTQSFASMGDVDVDSLRDMVVALSRCSWEQWDTVFIQSIWGCVRAYWKEYPDWLEVVYQAVVRRNGFADQLDTTIPLQGVAHLLSVANLDSQWNRAQSEAIQRQHEKKKKETKTENEPHGKTDPVTEDRPQAIVLPICKDEEHRAVLAAHVYGPMVQCIQDLFLGGGSFGRVNHLQYANTAGVVQKTLKSHEWWDEIFFHAYLQASIDKNALRSPCICPLVSYGTDTDTGKPPSERVTFPSCILQAASSTLDSYVRAHPVTTMHVDLVDHIAYSLLKALWVCDQFGLVHLDLKPENVLIREAEDDDDDDDDDDDKKDKNDKDKDALPQVWVSDIGIMQLEAPLVSNIRDQLTGAGTEGYMSIEHHLYLKRREKKFNKKLSKTIGTWCKQQAQTNQAKAAVASMGLILYWLLTGREDHLSKDAAFFSELYLPPTEHQSLDTNDKRLQCLGVALPALDDETEVESATSKASRHRRLNALLVSRLDKLNKDVNARRKWAELLAHMLAMRPVDRMSAQELLKDYFADRVRSDPDLVTFSSRAPIVFRKLAPVTMADHMPCRPWDDRCFLRCWFSWAWRFHAVVHDRSTSKSDRTRAATCGPVFLLFLTHAYLCLGDDRRTWFAQYQTSIELLAQAASETTCSHPSTATIDAFQALRQRFPPLLFSFSWIVHHKHTQLYTDNAWVKMSAGMTATDWCEAIWD
jgi:serine/threonine protein kinase